MTAVQPHKPTLRGCPSCRAVFRQAFARCPMDGHELQLLDDDPLVGTVLASRYAIEECIGEGGMGRVYRAKHTKMSRRFAVKILYGDLVADASMRERFSREAEIASRLSHPNLVGVVDFADASDSTGGLTYLVMEYVEGPNLTDLVESTGALGIDRAMALFRQLTSGLEHAHGQGLVHRDFKPDNIIVARTNDGEIAKILDFGIARILDSGTTAQLTEHGTIMGTPAFMSPQQASGEPVDHRTDLFSLGMVVYYMVCGMLPFDGDPMGVLRQNLALTPPAMADRVPGLAVHPQLEACVSRLLAKDPEARFQKARAVIDAIDAWWVPPRVRAATGSSPSLSSPALSASAWSLADSRPTLPVPAQDASMSLSMEMEDSLAFEPTETAATPPLPPSMEVPRAPTPMPLLTPTPTPTPMPMTTPVTSVSESMAATTIEDSMPPGIARPWTGDLDVSTPRRGRGAWYVAGAVAVAGIAAAVVLTLGGGDAREQARATERVASGDTGMVASGGTGGASETAPDAERPDSVSGAGAGSTTAHHQDAAPVEAHAAPDAAATPAPTPATRPPRVQRPRPPERRDDKPADVYDKRYKRVVARFNRLYKTSPDAPGLTALADDVAALPYLASIRDDEARLRKALDELRAIERRITQAERAARRTPEKP